MELLSNLFSDPVAESKKKNDDIVLGDSILVINRTKMQIVFFDGQIALTRMTVKEDVAEKRIPFHKRLSFEIGGYQPRIEFSINDTTDFVECFYTDRTNLVVSYRNRVLTCTNAARWESCKIVNRTNTNLTVLYGVIGTPHYAIRSATVHAKSFFPIKQAYCIYDDEGNVIYRAALEGEQPFSKFRITRSNGNLFSGEIFTIED